MRRIRPRFRFRRSYAGRCLASGREAAPWPGDCRDSTAAPGIGFKSNGAAPVSHFINYRFFFIDSFFLLSFHLFCFSFVKLLILKIDKRIFLMYLCLFIYIIYINCVMTKNKMQSLIIQLKTILLI